jgi:hypothetical protein
MQSIEIDPAPPHLGTMCSSTGFVGSKAPIDSRHGGGTLYEAAEVQNGAAPPLNEVREEPPVKSAIRMVRPCSCPVSK